MTQDLEELQQAQEHWRQLLDPGDPANEPQAAGDCGTEPDELCCAGARGVVAGGGVTLPSS